MLLAAYGNRSLQVTETGSTRTQKDSCHLGAGSVGFVQNFNSRNGRIVHDRFKSHVQFSLWAGFQMMEGLCDLVQTSGFLENIEVGQKRFSVADDIESPASHSAIPGCSRAEVVFGKVKHELVAAPRVHRDRIAEMAIPLAGDPGGHEGPLPEIGIRLPESALVVCQRYFLRGY